MNVNADVCFKERTKRALPDLEVVTVDGGVYRVPKFIVTVTLFELSALGNTLLYYKDIV